MSSDNLSNLPEYLNVAFAARMLAVVDRIGFKLPYEDLCRELGMSADPSKDSDQEHDENKKVLAMYAKGLTDIGICDSTRGKGGFGRKGMKIRPTESINVSESDLNSQWLTWAGERVRGLGADYQKGVSAASVGTLCFDDRRAQLLFGLALKNKRLPGFKLDGTLIKFT